MFNILLTALPTVFFIGVAGLLMRPAHGQEDNELSAGVPFGAVRPAVFFTLAACAAIAGFHLFYPLTAEYRYWIEEDWRGTWEECPGALWRLLRYLIILILLAAAVILPRMTVKRLSADGAFSLRRYMLSAMLTEGSMVIPLALYTSFGIDHDFHWLKLLPLADIWSVCRVIAMTVTVLSAEKAWRRSFPERNRSGRTTAIIGLLISYIPLTAGGYQLVRYFLGEYTGCPCELEGAADFGIMFIAAAIVAAAAFLVLSFIINKLRRIFEYNKKEKDNE